MEMSQQPFRSLQEGTLKHGVQTFKLRNDASVLDTLLTKAKPKHMVKTCCVAYVDGCVLGSAPNLRLLKQAAIEATLSDLRLQAFL